MTPNSRVLISTPLLLPTELLHIVRNTYTALPDDYVLQSSSRSTGSADGTTDAAGLDIAPAPLLPNYGAGRIGPYLMDLSMMCLVNAKERTLDEFIELG